MQSRRDQLQAYRFLVRRAVGAVVTGEPDIAESPMRRLTITTLSGVMVAVIVAAGVGVFGLLRPAPSANWKHDGAIVVDPQGTRYVYLSGKLYPTLNYTSAVLATVSKSGSNQKSATITQVSNKSIAGIPQGKPTGIADLPQSLPTTGAGLTRGPWDLCSDLTTVNSTLRTTVSLTLGGSPKGTQVPDDTGILVETPGKYLYLLLRGRRFSVNQAVWQNQLKAPNPIYVGDSFIAGVPSANASFDALRIPDFGRPITINGQATTVGHLYTVASSQQAYVAVANGYAPITGFILSMMELVPGNKPTALDSTPTPAVPSPPFGALPVTVPTIAALAPNTSGVCAVYTPPAATSSGGSGPSSTTGDAKTTQGSWRFSTVVADPNLSPGADTPQQGPANQVDVVQVPANGAALVTADQGADPSQSRWIVAASPGAKFAVRNPDTVLKAFGYDGVTPVRLPEQLLLVLPSGPDMDVDKIHTS